MVNFNQKSISMSSERTFTAPITDAAVYDAVVDALLADTTMGLTKAEKTSETYKTQIEYYDAEGEKAGLGSVTAYTRASYNAMRTHMTASETAASFAGTDGEAAELSSKATWNVRISCAIGTDTFSISLNRSTMVVSGYADAATIAAVETWADTRTALC